MCDTVDQYVSSGKKRKEKKNIKGKDYDFLDELTLKLIKMNYNCLGFVTRMLKK